MTVYGYARVSTREQKLKPQIELLLNADVSQENIYSEKYTGTTNKRPVFHQLISQLKDNDTLVVTKLDRLGRSVIGINQTVQQLTNAGVKINILNMGILDDKTATGKLIINIFASFAAFERDMIVTRTMEGKKYAKKHNPNYREGRPCRMITPRYRAIYEHSLHDTINKTAMKFGVSPSTVMRIRKQIKETELQTKDIEK